MVSPSWMMYISIVVLILFSAFFSASETAFSTFNRIRMKKKAQDGSAAARQTLKIAEDYDRTLSTILIGNNIVNIASSAVATIIATALWPRYGALVSTVVMTLLVLAFGEILPKSYAKQNADLLAPKIAGLLQFFRALLFPLSFVFTRLQGAFSKADPELEQPPSVTEKELIYMLDSIEEEGVIEEQERDLVQSALEFDEITVKEIFTPRVNLVAVDVDNPLDKITEVVISEGYSRIPVYENTVDNIIGVLFARDYLRCIVRGEEVSLRAMLSAPYFVHKGMKLSLLLSNLKARKVHLAVVLDEYGGTLGIVTMEDVLEELVGDIWDEDDEIPGGLVSLGENRFEVEASCDVAELFEELGYEEEDLDTEHTTVGGWAMQVLEHIPQAGEAFDYKDLRWTVLEMSGHRITRLGLERLEPPAEEQG